MGSNRRTWKLIVRYLAGESGPQERAEVEATIAVDDEKGALYDDVRTIWDEPHRPEGRLDVDEAWQNVDRRLREPARITRLATERAPSRRGARRSARVSNSTIWAAVIMIAVVIGTVVAVDVTVDPGATAQKPDFQVFATGRGERATVQLADGSRVLLSADSRLTVPLEFDASRRSVQFEGQGYFVVARDEERSFVVHTRLADVEVLGTEFDVHAYPESEQMQVVVATGEVSVRSRQREGGESIILKPRDLGLVLLEGGQLVRRNIDVSTHLAWQSGRLVFDNASFDEVVLQLERWYDLDVSLSRPSKKVDGLTVAFDDESVNEVLDVVSAALNLTYERSGKSVTFNPAS